MDFVKRHKLLSIFLQILIISIIYLFLMAACQGLPDKINVTPTLNNSPVTKTPTPQKSATPTPQPTSQFQVDASELEGVSIEFWHTWGGDEEKTITTLIKDFNRSNEWGISVSGVYKGGADAMGDAVYNAINTGGFPEIVMGYPSQASYWNSARKLILDLDDYRTDPVWGLSTEEEEAYFPVFQLSAETPDQWGFPAQRTAYFLIYNKTWSKALGYKTAPQTPKEFEIQACEAHKANLNDEDDENDTKGGLIISTNYPASVGWIYAFGGDMVADENKGYQFNTSQVKGALTFLRSLYDDGCAWVSDSRPPVEEFSKREGLFISADLDTLNLLNTSMFIANSPDEWEVIPFPSSEKPVIEVYGPDFFILKSEPAKQLASWLFIKWLTLPENQAKLIAVTGKLPLQIEVLDSLDMGDLPQPDWQAVVDLMPYARAEPALPSWGVVRWAVGDATTQLFQWYFEADQIPSLTKLLHETAANLHKNYP
ncbi:MAG: extracellular solute-binding protein [Anaerolineales bacterium]|nr:extracellular solute-binding protein [Anaerolineales bacterium]